MSSTGEDFDVLATRLEEEERWRESCSAYLALARAGHGKGSFESVACGLAGAIRVGRRLGYSDRRLLGYYDDFICFATRFGEHAMAAELSGEAADLAGSDARGYWIRAGDCWLRDGDALFVHLERPEMSRSSYHAALECFLRASERLSLSVCYQRLSVVSEDEARRAEFLGLAEKLGLKAGLAAHAWKDPPPHVILGLPPDCRASEAKAAYEAQVRARTPEQDPERFESLTRAFEVLYDERKLERYRRLRGEDKKGQVH